MKIAGLIIFISAIVALATRAGEPIQFSEPRRIIKTPYTDPVEELLNRPLEKFNPGNSLGDPVTPSFPLPQPAIIISKKNGEESIFNKAFLKQENSDFESSESGQIHNPNGLPEFGKKNLSPVEQYLLRQEKMSLANRQKQQSLEKKSAMFEFYNRQSEFKNSTPASKEEWNKDFSVFPRFGERFSGLLGTRDSLSSKLSSDAGLKTLMELREKDLAEKQNKERMEAFRRLLGNLPVNQGNGFPLDAAVNSARDLTRKNDNPVTISENDHFNYVDKNNARLSYDDYKNMRSRLNPLDESPNSSYQQNRSSINNFYSDPSAEREKQRPKPLLNPIPRRPF